MIRIVGMYSDQFISGQFRLTDKGDLVALGILYRDGFVGAIWGAKAALRCIQGGRR